MFPKGDETPHLSPLSLISGDAKLITEQQGWHAKTSIVSKEDRVVAGWGFHRGNRYEKKEPTKLPPFTSRKLHTIRESVSSSSSVSTSSATFTKAPSKQMPSEPPLKGSLDSQTKKTRKCWLCCF
jgi:hypothetical protein